MFLVCGWVENTRKTPFVHSCYSWRKSRKKDATCLLYHLCTATRSPLSGSISSWLINNSKKRSVPPLLPSFNCQLSCFLELCGNMRKVRVTETSNFYFVFQKKLATHPVSSNISAKVPNLASLVFPSTRLQSSHKAIYLLILVEVDLEGLYEGIQRLRHD